MAWSLVYEGHMYSASKGFKESLPLDVDDISKRDEAMEAAKKVWAENPKGHWEKGREDPRLVWTESLDV